MSETEYGPGGKPSPEVQAIARALHQARIEQLPAQVERDLAYMAGSYGEDYALAPGVLAALNEAGWLLLYNLLTPRPAAEGSARDGG